MGFRVEEGRLDFPLPAWRRVRQRVDAPREDDVEGAVLRELEKVRARVRPGMTVAVGVGSRGLARLPVMVRTVVSGLRAMGAEPFVVPAMGSHGGATPEGQRAVLAGYGVSEETIGAEIRAEMEVESLGCIHPPGSSGPPVPLWFSRAALAADAVLPLNRIKVHTSFHGPQESGLGKMLAIGFGKHAGAAGLHRLGTSAFRWLIPEATRVVLERVPVLGGLATVENAFEEPALVEFVPGERILEREPELLDLSRRLMPTIPFRRLDVLVVDYLGKDISGDGMDPNVTGRHEDRGLTDPERDPRKIVALRLTPASHGNACGLGLADVTTRAVVDAIDHQATWTNVITSLELGFGRIPMWMDDDRTAIALALSTCPGVDPSRARLVRIHSTLHLLELWVSEELWQTDGRGRPDLEALTGPVVPEFALDGRLADLPV